MPHQVWTGHMADFPRYIREQSGSHFLLLTARVQLSSSLFNSADLCQGYERKELLTSQVHS